MQRILFWLLVLLGLGLVSMLYLKFTVPHEDFTVYLKDAPNNPILGYVYEKDNYIVVEKDGYQRLFPWDEIKTISGPKPQSSRTAAFSFWLDKLDFLSSLGVFAALIVFSAGLYQYQQSLLWKREEFLANILPTFESQDLSNAKEILESMAQERKANIQLEPANGNTRATYCKVDSQEVIKALVAPIQNPTETELKIRGAFDSFLNRFEILDDYIRLRVVSKKSVYVQTGYWLDLLSRNDKLDDAFRKRLSEYAKFYGFDGFLRIVLRYNRMHRFLWWLRRLGRK
jgi:hypothetical protein